MIWNDSDNRGAEQAWCDYVMARAASRGAMMADDPALGEVVGGVVGAYLAAHAEGTLVAAKDVDFMVVRALWAFGRADLARHLAASLGDDQGAASLADVALAEQTSLPLWRAAFASGLVRPSRSEMAAAGVWVMDLATLRRELDGVWELGVFLALDALLSRIAFVWDVTAGHGLLGLWHAACIQPGSVASRRSRADWSRELRNRCSDRLERLRMQRGWSSTPRALTLDLL